jgi:hypothetical protein
MLALSKEKLKALKSVFWQQKISKCMIDSATDETTILWGCSQELVTLGNLAISTYFKNTALEAAMLNSKNSKALAILVSD